MLSHLTDTYAEARSAFRRIRLMNACFMAAWFAAVACLAIFVL